MENNSERMQPKGCKSLRLVEKYWDKEETKLYSQFFVDESDLIQGEVIFWDFNGKLSCKCIFKDGSIFGDFISYHENAQVKRIGKKNKNLLIGVYQNWWQNGRREYIQTHHLKKRQHGTQIEFKYEK